MTSVIQPTAVYKLFSGRVVIMLYGQPHDWQLGDMAPEVIDRICQIGGRSGVSQILAPRPSEFNAVICAPDKLKTKIERPEAVLLRGCDADGVWIPPGSAFWLSAADCVSLVACDVRSGLTIGSHAGRDCLFDRMKINGGIARRAQDSVVDSIMECFRQAECRPEDLKVFMTCGIAADHFAHNCEDEDLGRGNTRMVMHVLEKWGRRAMMGNPLNGCLILTEIIRQQFMAHGVLSGNIGHDVVDTYDDGKGEDHLWWSHRRGDGRRRNGILIVRKY